MRQEFGEFDLHHQFSRLKHGQYRQCGVENIESSNRRTHVHIEGDAHGTGVKNPRFALIIDDHARAHHIAHAFHIKLAAQLILAVTQKFIIAGKNTVELLVRERCILLVDPTVAFAFAFQFDHTIAVIVDANTVFPTQQHTVDFFLICGVPIIVEIQAANHIAAVFRMLVEAKQRRHTHVQVGFLRV